VVSRFLRAAGRITLRAATALGLVFFLVTFTPVLRWWTRALATPWGYDEGEVLVVLGGEMAAGDLLGTGTAWRCYYAMLVWRQSHVDRILVSGHSAAPVMKTFLVDRGIPADRIQVEDDSESTRENAVQAACRLKGTKGRIILLTSDYHAGRALRAFRKAGVTASPLPFPDALKRINSLTQRWEVFLLLLDETAKVVYYQIRGWG